MNQKELENRISELQNYINLLDKTLTSQYNDLRKAQLRTYRGFALLIKELFENQKQSLSENGIIKEDDKNEKVRDETVDWMTKWLQEQANDLEDVNLI